MVGTVDFAKMVPGFDFLQGLMKNAGAGMPSVGQWIAPTLDPDELEKRISELRTVQFWLEQNAKLLATTITAMEVQRMTLATLRTMNLPLTDLRESLKINPAWGAAAPPPSASTPPSASWPASEPARSPSPPPSAAPSPPQAGGSDAAEPSGAKPPALAPPGVDPMKWWGALTQQFTELAAKTLKDTAAAATAASSSGASSTSAPGSADGSRAGAAGDAASGRPGDGAGAASSSDHKAPARKPPPSRRGGG